MPVVWLMGVAVAGTVTIRKEGTGFLRGYDRRSRGRWGDRAGVVVEPGVRMVQRENIASEEEFIGSSCITLLRTLHVFIHLQIKLVNIIFPDDYFISSFLTHL